MMKYEIISLYDEVMKLKEYFIENKFKIFFFSATFLLVYGAWIYNLNPRIDNEVMLNDPYSTYNWLILGRQGAIFTKMFFGLLHFNPFVATLFGYLICCLTGAMYAYLFNRCGIKNNLLNVSMIIILFVNPIFVEQFYFDLQIFEVAFALLLCVLATGLSYYGILYKSKVAYVLSLIFMVWIFSTYQIFVIVFITNVVFVFILLYQKWTLKENRKIDDKKYLMIIVKLIVLFFVALFLNETITRMFFYGGENYFNSQIMWKNGNIKNCILNIAKHIYMGITGKNAFYTCFFGIALFSIIGYCIYIVCNSNKKLKFLYILALMGLQLCPFLLTILAGNIPAIRSQLVYPLVLSFDLIFILNVCIEYKKSILKYFFIVCYVMCIWNNIQVTMRLIYTDEIRAQEDIRLAEMIQQRIYDIGAENKPIAFVGVYQNKLNNACIRGELIGESIFNWDSIFEPFYYHSSRRSSTISMTLGFPFYNVSAEQMYEARTIAKDLPVWPNKGSVVDNGEFVIVKLSEDPWIDELK